MIRKVKPPNPSGLCMCGCGRPTKLAKCTNVARGFVRGEHTRYIHGHGGCRIPPQRRGVYVPYEPTANQLAADLAAIQATWSATEEQSRIVDSRLRKQPVTPQVVPMTPQQADRANVLRIGRRGI